jgi:hypothetical protein
MDGAFAVHVQLRPDASQCSRPDTVVVPPPALLVNATLTRATPDPASAAVPSTDAGLVVETCVPSAVEIVSRGGVRSAAGRVGATAEGGRTGPGTGGAAIRVFAGVVEADGPAAEPKFGTAMAVPAGRPGVRGLGTKPKLANTK